MPLSEPQPTDAPPRPRRASASFSTRLSRLPSAQPVVPARVLEPEAQIRIRTITAAMIAMVIVGVPFVVRYYLIGMNLMAAFVAAVVVIAVLNMWVVRRVDPRWAGHLAYLLLFSVLLASNITSGGFYNPNFSWLYVVPLAGAILVNKKAAIFLTLLVGLTAVVFWSLPSFDIHLVDHIPEAEREVQALINRLTAIFAIGLLTWIFVQQQQRAEHDLKTASADLQKESARVAELAYFDSLTGLPNRRHFLLKLQTDDVLRNVALVCLDLENFKDVNDTLGPSVGDLVLKEVSRRLELQVGRIKTAGSFLARVGADEFALFVPGATEEDAIGIAETILVDLRRVVQLPGREIFVTASAGVALTEVDSGRPPSELLMQADAAMHTAKRAGGNSYRVFAHEMKSEHERRVIMGARLRRSLEDDSGLELFYQPIFSATDGAILGMEALLRWTDDGRSISPNDFVPIAEAIGLAPRLDAWVIERALRDLREIDTRASKQLRMAINISATHVRDSEVVERIQQRLQASGIMASRVELEMTESALIASDPIVDENIARLHEVGFGIVLDDFGTGYSSLSHLRDFPVTKLKIDRSFVEGADLGNAAAKLCQSVAALGHGMGLEVVAEGIETPGQKAAVVSMGCTQLQGYLLSHPVELSELLVLIGQHADATDSQTT